MKKPALAVGVLLVLALVAPWLRAQQGGESLGEVARKERERKKAQPKPAQVLTNENTSKDSEKPREMLKQLKEQAAHEDAKSSGESKPAMLDSVPGIAGRPARPPQAKASGRAPEEERAFRTIFAVAVAEEECWGIVGYYVALEQMLSNGCVGLGGHVTFKPREDSDPRTDSNYDYPLLIRGNVVEISANPRRGGLAGFFYDGAEFYVNRTGSATAQDHAMDKDEILDWLHNGGRS